MSVPAVEGHLGAAFDGYLLVSVDKAGSVVVVEEKQDDPLVDEGTFRHTRVAVVPVAMGGGSFEDTRNRDLEFAVLGQRRVAKLLVDVFGNFNLGEEANATDGPALVELFLGSGVDELLAFLLGQHMLFDLEGRKMCCLAAEVFLAPVDTLALLAKLERRGEDGRYGGGAKEEKGGGDAGEIHGTRACVCLL